MRSSFVLSTVAAVAMVGAEDINFAGVDAVLDPIINIIPGLKEQVVPFNGNKAIAAAVSQVAAGPLDVKPVSQPTAVPKVKRAACDQEPSNANTYGFDLSSASKFRADTKVASVAKAASASSGYYSTFTNLQGASSAYSYLGYKVVTSYDPASCASECDSKSGCLGFNICKSSSIPWLSPRRTANLNPGPRCQNPDAVANIKCYLWGGPVYTDTATNTGQWREQFEGAFDAKLCATACQEANKYTLEHPPIHGKPLSCRYFNTYILLENGGSQCQYCSMYTQEWDASYATNNGQYHGEDHYTIQYSFGFTDESDDGVPVCPNDLGYLKSSAQDFCTSYVGYKQLTTTATTTATTRPALQTTTVTKTSTSYTTAEVTQTAQVWNGRRIRRADNGTDVTNNVIVDPYKISVVTVKTLSRDDSAIIPQLNDTMAAELGRVQKRDLSTPASISAWPTNKISAVCSQIATGTSTTTATQDFQTVVVQQTCTAPAPRPTAPSYLRITGGNPTDGVPMVPGPADRSYMDDSFTLALPFAVKIFETPSTQNSINIGGFINVGPYQFDVFANTLYMYGGWRHGLFHRVDGDICSRQIHFSWFSGSYYWGHEHFHFTATFDEAKPSILNNKVFDTLGQVTPRRTVSVNGNAKSIPFAQLRSNNVHEGQGANFDTTGAGSVSTRDFDRINCCHKTDWWWHVCTEV